jgi:translation initiation factor IF-2
VILIDWLVVIRLVFIDMKRIRTPLLDFILFQEHTKDMLVPHGIQVEDRGGDVQAIPISALAGTNLDVLSEAILLQAELMDLKGDPRGMVEGVVVESRTDPRRGYDYFPDYG